MVLGSNTSGTSYNDFWMYNPTTNAWTPAANFGGRVRSGAPCFSIGSYGYVGTGINGGAYATDFWQYTPQDVGIEEHSLVNHVLVYPNPFVIQSVFSLTNELKNATLRIYNLQGKEVKTKDFEGKEVVVERESLANGIYLYQIIEDNKKIATGKIVLE